MKEITYASARAHFIESRAKQGRTEAQAITEIAQSQEALFNRRTALTGYELEGLSLGLTLEQVASKALYLAGERDSYVIDGYANCLLSYIHKCKEDTEKSGRDFTPEMAQQAFERTRGLGYHQVHTMILGLSYENATDQAHNWQDNEVAQHTLSYLRGIGYSGYDLTPRPETISAERAFANIKGKTDSNIGDLRLAQEDYLKAGVSADSLYLVPFIGTNNEPDIGADVLRSQMQTKRLTAQQAFDTMYPESTIARKLYEPGMAEKLRNNKAQAVHSVLSCTPGIDAPSDVSEKISTFLPDTQEGLKGALDFHRARPAQPQGESPNSATVPQQPARSHVAQLEQPQSGRSSQIARASRTVRNILEKGLPSFCTPRGENNTGPSR